MARKKLPDRVICIQERKTGTLRFRLHYVERGVRRVAGFATQADADRAATLYAKKTAPLQTEIVSDLIGRYQEDMLARGLWQRNARALSMKVSRLRHFLAPAEDMPVGAVSPEVIRQCCKAWDSTERQAHNTRRDGRIRALAFFNWCIEQRLIRSNPVVSEYKLFYKPTPKKRLRIDDAKALRSVLDPAADAGSLEATFVLTLLLLGPRSSELVNARVTQLDDGGRILTYLDAKNKTTLHEVRLPHVLLKPFANLVKQAEARGDDMLFGVRSDASKRAWPAAQVRTWAKRAGLPFANEMDARWLRRSKDSIAVEAGLAAEAVAKATGHTTRVARTHYIADGAETTGRAANMAESTAPESLPIVTASRKSRKAR